MKPQQLLLLLLLLALHSTSHAQEENNIWIFGNNDGIDFNATPPVPVSGSMLTTLEGCASISNSSGSLLFYSNGDKVWDKTNTVMPNGAGLSSGSTYSSTQGVAIAPVPYNANQFLLITIQEEGGVLSAGKVEYSVIDMTLNSGKGDVVSGKKTLLIADSMSEKLALAPACDGIWLLMHDIDSPIFYAFKITSATIIDPPVISHTPGIVQDVNYVRGKAIFSEDFSKIAIGNYYIGFGPPTGRLESLVEVFDFDKKTGVVSGYVPVDTIGTTYGLEFSEDASKLYAVSQLDRHVYQYDLSLSSVAAIRASKYTVGGIYIDARRGPDNKIYLNPGGSNGFGRINNPDMAGAACGFTNIIPSLPGGGLAAFALGMGEKTIPFTPFTEDTLYARKDTLVCAGSTVPLAGAVTHHQFVWNDGDTARERVFTKEGLYWVRSVQSCSAYVDSFGITFSPADTTDGIHLDTVVCAASEARIKAPVAADHYLWSDGTTGDTDLMTGDGIRVVYSSVKTAPCALRTDTVTVSFVDLELHIPDQHLCGGQQVILDASSSGAESYRWSDGTNGSSIEVHTGGTFWVQASSGGCSVVDTIIVSSGAFSLDLGQDRSLCAGSSLLLDPGIADAQYQWQDGSTNSSFLATDSSWYRVTVTKDGCSETDEVYLGWIRCKDCIAIPNAFTPDKDGINDGFKVLLRCPVQRFHMMIMNRYGQEVYSSTDALATWDGTFNGMPMDSGVFYYMFKITFDSPGAKEEMYKGDITLLR